MLTKPSYFEGGLSLGQLTYPDVWLRVQRVAERREPELLGDLLGDALYGELLAGLTPPEDAEAGWQPEARWTALEKAVARMVAGYVFYWYVRENEVSMAGAGAVEEKTDNARRVTPTLKMCDAWNTIADGMGRLERLVSEGNGAEPPLYPSYAQHPCCGESYRRINVLGI
jgi:hypothetical protein